MRWPSLIGRGCKTRIVEHCDRRRLAVLATIGHTTPRVDAIARVTGQAKYTQDIKLPGMLYARMLRSPHPHARILSIVIDGDRNCRGAGPGYLYG